VVPPHSKEIWRIQPAAVKLVRPRLINGIYNAPEVLPYWAVYPLVRTRNSRIPSTPRLTPKPLPGAGIRVIVHDQVIHSKDVIGGAASRNGEEQAVPRSNSSCHNRLQGSQLQPVTAVEGKALDS
jgi:hypothetical protein